MAIRELEKTLLIGNELFNINAKKAEQVENELAIEMSEIDNTRTKYYIGNEPVKISIVPSSGGTFKGPIRAQSGYNEETEEGFSNDAVITFDDIEKALDAKGIKFSQTDEPIVADKLAEPVSIKVDLESSGNSISFDGSESEYSIPVIGILPENQGGTGTESLEDVVVGTAQVAQVAQKINVYSTDIANSEANQVSIFVGSEEPDSDTPNGSIWIKI